MPENVIMIDNLGKKYLIGHQRERNHYITLRDTLTQNFRAFLQGAKKLTKGIPIIQGDKLEEIWALRDINLAIKEGERIGIIGRNGAGKSTLLKILSRITEPSTGRVTIKGRVASLLEVGTGFHPELTGRDNIFLNGAILGMSRQEIKRKFDEIVAFAEVEKFLDTPVKRYSSGMYVRLAFAVAANLEPEILLVDEVLAVGDAQFQKKCLGKMGDVSKQGRTILFVSHNMNAIEQLCERALLFSNGVLEQSGPTELVVQNYKNSFYDSEAESAEIIYKGPPSPYLNPIRMGIYNENGDLCNIYKKNDRIKLVIEFDIVKFEVDLSLGISLFDANMNHLFRTLFTDTGAISIDDLKMGYNRISCWLPSDILNEGKYKIVFDASLYMKSWDFNPFSDHNFSLQFYVEGGFVFSNFWRTKRAGIFAPMVNWKKESIF